ncbi:putative deSI-like protein [Cocos nucifera]|uniref:Putative deSI-like protein n=1 Tax=Cocos nucifera TaxID=13894 RepID=A0A8K0MZC8_COCNU|nr:putative deSI-like protein [Cocos nucifera]
MDSIKPRRLWRRCRKMFIRVLSRKRTTRTVPMYLNVYDLIPINVYDYWLGLDVYHSGVQVHGVEYTYGVHEHTTTGIFAAEPRHYPGFVFRKSILIGRTDLGLWEVPALMEELATEYTDNTYNLIFKKCNHFCNEACLRLTNKPISSTTAIIREENNEAQERGDWI